MADVIASMMAGEIRLLTNRDISVVDSTSGGGRTVTVDAGYYRILLAPTGSLGTRVSPHDLLLILVAELNDVPAGDHWAVELTTAGLVKITWVGGTGAASITWDSGNTLRDVLGFTATCTFAAPGASVTATYQPTHTLFSICCANDAGWTPIAPFSAAASPADGTVIGEQDENNEQMVRSFDLQFHPKDNATAVSEATPGTAMFPTKARWKTPGILAGTDPPWSVKDHVRACAFKPMAVAIGTFSAHMTGATKEYDVAYIDEDTIRAVRPTSAQIADRYYQWRAFGIRFFSYESRV